MTGMREPERRQHGVGDDIEPAHAPELCHAHACRVLVVDADAALYGLLAEWLGALGCTLEHARSCAHEDAQRFDLVVIDVPFPRQAGADIVRSVARERPQAPIVVLSSSFFAGIEPGGAVARSLGVSAVLPKPLKREALLAAVRKALRLPQ